MINRVTDRYAGLSSSKASMVLPQIVFHRFEDPLKSSRLRSGSEEDPETGDSTPITSPPDYYQHSNRSSYLGVFGDLESNLVSSLVDFTVTKTLKAPCGAFTIALMPRIVSGTYAGYCWYDVLSSGDWVHIKATTDYGDPLTIMTGKIDSITTSMMATGDSISSVVIIKGRDVASAIVDMSIYINPYDPVTSNLFGHTMLKIIGPDTPNTFAGVPHEMVPTLMRAILRKQVGISMPPKVPPGLFDSDRNSGNETVETLWGDHLDLESGVKGMRGFIWDPNVITPKNGQTGVWQWFNKYQNPALNEMFIDSDYSGKPFLVFRERPFENLTEGLRSPWFTQLQTNEIPLDQVVSLNFEQGLNRVNYIYIMAQLGFIQKDSFNLSSPQINKKDIERHGFKMLFYRTNYMNLDASRGQDISYKHSGAENDKWVSLLVNWHALNHHFSSGVVSLACLRPDLKVGEKAVFSGGPSPLHPILTGEPEPTFNPFADVRNSTSSRDCGTATTGYIEGVSHRWSAATGTGTTTLQLTRIYPENLRLPDLEEAIRNRNWSFLMRQEASITPVQEYETAVASVQVPSSDSSFMQSNPKEDYQDQIEMLVNQGTQIA